MRTPSSLLILLLAAVLLSVGCLPGFAPTPTPMPSLELVERTPSASCTAILLPGMFTSGETFRRQGFAALIEEKAPGLDVIGADAHLAYYRKKLILTRLQEDLIGPEIEDGRKVWLLGTSLGGIGALLYARGQNGDQKLPDADRLAGVVLLGPFLGNKKLIKEIDAAGGPLAWQPSEADRAKLGSRDAVYEATWTWLIDWHHRTDPKPRIVLGWGAEDRFAPAARLAAQLLPASDSFERPGGHDWDVWRELFSDMLDSGLFAECAP